jgi:hypothetical protein
MCKLWILFWIPHIAFLQQQKQKKPDHALWRALLCALRVRSARICLWHFVFFCFFEVQYHLAMWIHATDALRAQGDWGPPPPLWCKMHAGPGRASARGAIELKLCSQWSENSEKCLPERLLHTLNGREKGSWFMQQWLRIKQMELTTLWASLVNPLRQKCQKMSHCINLSYNLLVFSGNFMIQQTFSLQNSSINMVNKVHSKNLIHVYQTKGKLFLKIRKQYYAKCRFCILLSLLEFW